MNIDYGNPITLWVCQDCIMHHANGECGSCHDDSHDEEPLHHVDYRTSAMGLARAEHKCGRQDDTYFGECDCETKSYSTSSCDGCGSYLHGERHAMTEWLVKG